MGDGDGVGPTAMPERPLRLFGKSVVSLEPRQLSVNFRLGRRARAARRGAVVGSGSEIRADPTVVALQKESRAETRCGRRRGRRGRRGRWNERGFDSGYADGWIYRRETNTTHYVVSHKPENVVTKSDGRGGRGGRADGRIGVRPLCSREREG
jgi:hypothetical protein